ncbi:MAG TPA: hypothetical protein VL947_10545 [Cytophagales bacterium]|nr:hypothetical protein [Cytophagales bacterium]
MEFEFNTKEDIEHNVYMLSYADESEENEKVLQKCIQKAQFYKDKDLEFEARMAYLRQVNWLNKKEKAIATMPWLLNRLDEGHNQDFAHNILWMYKWIIINLPDFAAISLAQIEQLTKDMEKRFLDYGTGIRIVHYFKMIQHSSMGQLEEAKAYMKLYLQDHSESNLDDCSACQPNNLLSVYLNLKEYDSFLDKAAPLLSRAVTCKEVPDYTYPKTALVNYIVGNYDEAAAQALMARKKIKLKKAVLREMGHLLAYYALTKEFVKGRTIIEKQLDFCALTQPELFLFRFYLGMLMFFTALHREGKKQIKLQVETKSLLPIQEGSCHVNEALGWLQQQLQTLAHKLNIRNGNDFYAQEIQYYMGLLDQNRPASHP